MKFELISFEVKFKNHKDEERTITFGPESKEFPIENGKVVPSRKLFLIDANYERTLDFVYENGKPAPVDVVPTGHFIRNFAICTQPDMASWLEHVEKNKQEQGQ